MGRPLKIRRQEQTFTGTYGAYTGIYTGMPGSSPYDNGVQEMSDSDMGQFFAKTVGEYFASVGTTGTLSAVSYTHLTLPTKA